MTEPKFKLGDLVFLATWERQERKIECPDCAGTGRIRLIMADESHVAIPCENCSQGYDPPTGYVTTYDFLAKVETIRIQGIECGVGRETRYSYNRSSDGGRYNVCQEASLWRTEFEAQLEATRLQVIKQAEEEARFKGKYDGKRTWAWNASYHRKEIKKAKDSLAYHERMLETAALRARNSSE